MEVDLNPETINSIIVKDEAYPDNLPRGLSSTEIDKFLELLEGFWKDQLFPHLTFTIEYKNGETLEVLTERNRVKIGDELFVFYPGNRPIEGEYPFVKIGKYHKKIGVTFRLLEMKRYNPTHNWINNFVTVNYDDMFTPRGLIEADEAFNLFIMNLYYETESGELTKEKAYGFARELFENFNKIEDDRLLNLYSEEKGDILVYANHVLDSLGLYDKDLDDQSSFSLK